MGGGVKGLWGWWEPFGTVGCEVEAGSVGVGRGTPEGSFRRVCVGDGAGVHPVWFQVESVVLYGGGEYLHNLAYVKWEWSGFGVHLETGIVVFDDGG